MKFLVVLCLFLSNPVFSQSRHQLGFHEMVALNLITVKECIRVYRAIINTVGATSSNEGIITISESGNEVTHIAVEEGQTTLGVYTVPRNHKLLIYEFVTGLAKKQTTSGDAHFETRPFGGAWNVKQVVSLSNGSSFERDTSVPFSISEKTDIRIRFEDITTNDTGGVCSFDGILINNAKFTGN